MIHLLMGRNWMQLRGSGEQKQAVGAGQGDPAEELQCFIIIGSSSSMQFFASLTDFAHSNLCLPTALLPSWTLVWRRWRRCGRRRRWPRQRPRSAPPRWGSARRYRRRQEQDGASDDDSEESKKNTKKRY